MAISSEFKPVVYFNTHYNNGFVRKKVVNLTEGKPIDSGIELKEFNKVKVELLSEDKNAFLQIQLTSDERPKIIPANSGEVKLLRGGNKNHMLVPGEYLMKVKSFNTYYKAFFTITSQYFSRYELLNLKRYLNKMIRGLIYDLNEKRYGFSTETGMTVGSLAQFYEKLNKERTLIISVLKSIIEDPIETISNEYQIRAYTRKPDLKSYRWQISKGSTKGGTNHKPFMYYEKQTVLTTKNVENQWIKYILQELLDAFKTVYQIFVIEKKKLKERKVSIKLELERNKSIRDDLNKKGFGFYSQLNIVKNEINRQKEELEQIRQRLKSVVNNTQKLKWWNTRLIFMKEEHWLHHIEYEKPKRVPHALIRDLRYKKIYDYYEELYYIKKKDATLDSYSTMYRRTWELYEYYTVGLVIDILHELGYKWISGWLADYDNLYLDSGLGSLPQNTLMYFLSNRNDHYIELAYDYKLERFSSEPVYNGQYYSRRGRRPDIRLTLLDSNKEIYSQQDPNVRAGLIIEVKYRNHKYLLDKKFSPDVKEQLEDFLDLRYYGPNLPKAIRPVKQVIVVYPKQKGQKPFVRDALHGNELVYLQMKPSDPDNKVTPFGYKRLQKEIMSFINQIQKEEIYDE